MSTESFSLQAPLGAPTHVPLRSTYPPSAKLVEHHQIVGCQEIPFRNLFKSLISTTVHIVVLLESRLPGSLEGFVLESCLP